MLQETAGAYSWRKLPPELGKREAGENLALSEGLLSGQVTPSIRWYSAACPALVLGTAQKPQILNRNICNQRNLKIYRRSSGGSLVLAEPAFLSLDIVLPPGHPLALPDVTETYRWLGEVWQQALELLKINNLHLVTIPEVRTQTQNRQNWSEIQQLHHRLSGLVCFATLSPYEISYNGKKLVGFSQIRRRSGTLLQCGLPLLSQACEFSDLFELATTEINQLKEILELRLTGLDKIIEQEGAANPFPEVESNSMAQALSIELINAFERVLCKNWGISLIETGWTALELEQARRLATQKFGCL